MKKGCLFVDIACFERRQRSHRAGRHDVADVTVLPVWCRLKHRRRPLAPLTTRPFKVASCLKRKAVETDVVARATGAGTVREAQTTLAILALPSFAVFTGGASCPLRPSHRPARPFHIWHPLRYSVVPPCLFMDTPDIAVHI